MNNIQELIERLEKRRGYAVAIGGLYAVPVPYAMFNSLINVLESMQTPLPEDVERVCKELDEARRWRSSPENRHARIFPEAIGMLERLWRENEEYARRDILLSDDNTELQQRIEELEANEKD